MSLLLQYFSFLIIFIYTINKKDTQFFGVVYFQRIKITLFTIELINSFLKINFNLNLSKFFYLIE